MNIPRTPARWVIAVVCVVAVAGACSRGGDLAAPTPSTTSSTLAVGAGESSAVASSSPSSPSSSLAVSPGTDGSATGATAESVAPDSRVTSPPVSVVVVPEEGVPGLDSDDAFCSSWSRFAGSFQVVAVTAAFGSGSPEQLAALEVAAAPTVTAAYRQLLESWPDELADEADLVADEFLGPFARRLEVAEAMLGEVGADAEAIAAIEAAWLDGLARRDPTTPEFVVDLPDDLWVLIDAAAAEFAQQRVSFTQDPSLVTDVQTPLTSEYLAASCPDQGTLSGQEVDTP